MADCPAMTTRNKPGPVLAVVAGAIVISSAPILVKAAYGAGAGLTAVGAWRCLIGTVLLTAVVVATGGRLRLPLLEHRWLWLASVAYALDLFVWHQAIDRIGAGMATILGNTQVFGTALLSRWFFKETIPKIFAVASVLAWVGIVLLVGVGSGVMLAGDYLVGIGLGLATGVFYSIYLLCVRGSGLGSDGSDAPARLAWICAYTGVLLLPMTWIAGEPLLPQTATAWGLIALLALLPQTLGWWVLARSLPQVTGAVGGLLLLLQPVLATLWGATIYGEALAPLQWAGAALTLGAIGLGSARR